MHDHVERIKMPTLPTSIDYYIYDHEGAINP